MTEIPTEKAFTDKSERAAPNRVRLLLKWLHFAFILIIASILYYFRYYNTLEQLSIYTVEQEQKILNITEIDINVEEYEKLGLTPIKPIQIASYSINKDGNDHQHKKTTIHGRFLHITDIHPDAYYVEGSEITDNACHRGKPGKGEPKASKYGDALLGCDSPLILMNETLEWIRTNLRDKIDFVIWTGDNIRHDNDRKIPRTEMQIFDMNREVATAFHDIFHGDELDPRHYDVPVVPSLGNNDVYPHNLFAPGPTLQTREMWSIWQSFVPEEQLHIFERGAYYFNEVIANKLAVLSINTLYLFKSNPLVDSCDNRKDPGFKLLTWLGITLEELRQRNMKVWLSGHVPPIAKNYDISCYRKFAIWLHEYRDVIIGGVYGHMNIDHFVPVDSTQAYKSYLNSLIAKGYETDETIFSIFEDDEDDQTKDLETLYLELGYNVSDHDLNVAIAANEAHALGGVPTNKENYMNTVRSSIYADIKKPLKSGEHAERYAITNIAASVIPTFNPGFRVWEYNITGILDNLELESKPWTEFFKDLDKKIFDNDENDDDEDDEDEDFIDISKKKNNKKKGKKSKKPKNDPSLPKKKPEDAPLGPGYTPQLFSPTKFVQYYLDLEAINKGKKPFDYEVEYKSTDAPLNLKGLLVEDFVALGRKFGKPLKSQSIEDIDISKKKKGKENKNNKSNKDKEDKLDNLWDKYVEYAFVSSGYHD